MDNLRTLLIRQAATHPVGSSFRRYVVALLRQGEIMEKRALRIREMGKLLALGFQFAVLTPYGPGAKSDNKERMQEFYRDLQAMGYRNVEPLKGQWEGKTERSVLVPGMKFQDAIALGKKYHQDAVIYKDPSGTIGVYYTKDGTAEVAIKPSGDMAADMHADKDLFSKARGISFEFGVLWGQKVPWDGTNPISRDDVQKWVEEGVVHPT